MVKQAESPSVDGRRARSERSRQAIINAALALMEEGNLIPTAQQVSDRAGVGIRSFFRHFEDMGTLFSTIEKQTRHDTEALYLGGDRSGTLQERVLHAVERRSAAFEQQTNKTLSTSAQLWRYESTRKSYARYQRGLRKDLENWLPELEAVAGERREAAHAVASFDMWHRLRRHQGLPESTARKVIVSLLSAQLQGPGG